MAKDQPPWSLSDPTRASVVTAAWLWSFQMQHLALATSSLLCHLCKHHCIQGWLLASSMDFPYNLRPNHKALKANLPQPYFHTAESWSQAQALFFFFFFFCSGIWVLRHTKEIILSQGTSTNFPLRPYNRRGKDSHFVFSFGCGYSSGTSTRKLVLICNFISVSYLATRDLCM